MPSSESRPSFADALEGLVYEEKYSIDLTFSSDIQLEPGSDVRIGGVSVGTVDRVQPMGSRTSATLEIEPEFAPIDSEAKAILRPKTLLGETYVELTPAGTGDSGPRLEEIYEAVEPEADRTYREFLEEAELDSVP